MNKILVLLLTLTIIACNNTSNETTKAKLVEDSLRIVIGAIKQQKAVDDSLAQKRQQELEEHQKQIRREQYDAEQQLKQTTANANYKMEDDPNFESNKAMADMHNEEMYWQRHFNSSVRYDADKLFGAIKNASVVVNNKCDFYNAPNIRLMVQYIKRNGDVCYTHYQNVGYMKASSTQVVKVPDMNCGVKLSAQIISIK